MSEVQRPNATLGTLLSLAWPVIVSRSTQVVIGVSDAVMVSSLGASALAATTAGGLNTFAFMILPMGVTFIVASFASQLYGRGDLAGARRFGHYGLLLAAVTQVFGMLGVFFIPWLLARFDYAPDVRVQMASYMGIRLFSTGAAIGMEALGNYYGGIGNTRLPMAVSIFAMAINVVGNYALIGGHFGAPAMGVNGAALSNTISTWLAFLLFVGVFAWSGRGMERPKLALREVGRMLRFGLPSGLNWFFEFYAYNIFVSVVVASLGTTAVAAMMAVQQINSVAFMPAFGLASAGAILVGQAIGARAKDEVPRIVKMTFGTAATWQGLVALACLVAPGLLLRPFVGGEGADALVHTGRRMVMLSAAWQLFDAIAGAVSEALRAAGDTAFPLWARTIVAWVIFVPGSYVTVKYLGGGELGALAWFLAYFVMLAVVMTLRFRTGAWRTMELTEPEVAT
ncbi:MAG: MATE family efflux transporter [Polyangiaceae bacterium]